MNWASFLLGGVAAFGLCSIATIAWFAWDEYRHSRGLSIESLVARVEWLEQSVDDLGVALEAQARLQHHMVEDPRNVNLP